MSEATDVALTELLRQRDTLEAEVARLQRLFLEVMDDVTCEDLCLVRCAGPCEGRKP